MIGRIPELQLKWQWYVPNQSLFARILQRLESNSWYYPCVGTVSLLGDGIIGAIVCHNVRTKDNEDKKIYYNHQSKYLYGIHATSGQTLWRFSMGTNFVIAGGNVIKPVMDQWPSKYGDGIHVIDIQTGKKLRSIHLEHSGKDCVCVAALPTLALFLDDGQHSLFAVDTKDGRIKWKRNRKKGKFIDAVIGEKVVYVIQLSEKRGARKSYDGLSDHLYDFQIWALDITSGRLKGEFSFSNESGYGGMYRYDSLGDLIFFVDGDNYKLYAINIQKKWEFTMNAESNVEFSPPIIGDETAFIHHCYGSGYVVRCLSMRSGRLLWQEKQDVDVLEFGSGSVFFVKAGIIHKVNPKTGKTMWKKRITSKQNHSDWLHITNQDIWVSIHEQADQVEHHEYKLLCLDLASGEERFCIFIDNGFGNGIDTRHPPCITSDTVYIANHSNPKFIRAFSLL